MPFQDTTLIAMAAKAAPSTQLLVANMSPEQANRKRAGDRINQRWSRARKQGRITQLEHENAEVRAQNERLVVLLAEAREELKRLREQHNALGAAVEAAHTLFHRPCVDMRPPGPIALDIDPVEGEALPPTHTALDAVATSSPRPPTFPTTTDMNPSINLPLDLPLDFGTGIAVNLFNDQSLGGDFLSWAATEQFFHDSSAVWADETAAHATLQNAAQSDGRLAAPHLDSTPAWQVLPVNVSPTTALDRVLVEVAESGRRFSQQRGRYHEELSQTNFPSLSSLLEPTSADPIACPVASAVGNHTTWGTTVVAFPSRVAYHYLVAHMVRWLVCRTQESYEELPEFIRPTTMQLTVPHPAWIDLFPWCVHAPAICIALRYLLTHHRTEARDLLIRNMDFSKFELFQRLTSTFSVNWPYKDSDMFIADPSGTHITLNPVFKAHIRNIKNWTFSSTVVDAFPFLGTYTAASGAVRF